MSKIIYIANITLPSERAHGIQIMKTCEALVQNGEQVELWITNRKKAGEGRGFPDNIFNFYGVKRKFPIKKIPVIELISKKCKAYFYLESFSFLIMAFFALLRKKGDFIIYTRDESVQFLKFFTGKKIFWESHDKISAAHDAVDIDDFSDFLPKNKARDFLGIPQDKKVVLYIGGIVRHKGIFVLLDVAAMLGDDYLFEIVGWFVHDESDLAKKYVEDKKIGNVIFRGYIPRNDIPKYLSSADVLVIPNSSLNEESRAFTSPMKLFEYMSSGRPVVASATTTILEILNEKNAILVKPDSPEDLKNGILKIFQDENLARTISENAKKDVQNYTWIKRAQKISAFIKKGLA